MRYSETRTQAASHPVISEFWRFDAEALDRPTEHIIPPDGLVSIWRLQRAGGDCFSGVTGPSAQAMRSTLEDRMTIFGARLKPCASARFFSLPAKALCGQRLPLAAVAPDFVASFSDAAASAFSGDYRPLERAFDELHQRAKPADSIAVAMAEQLMASDGAAEIGALAKSLGLSPQAARRRFQAAMGLNPKDFARIRRIRRACVDALSANARWTSVSLEAGFADQAHFARECRNVFDMPPREMKKTLERIRHGAIFSG
jgi:methylphosphotriester-DNA--protein-cysteine methyltransferase